MTITNDVQRTAQRWTASAAARARRVAGRRLAEMPRMPQIPQMRRQSASDRFFEQTELALRGVPRTPASPLTPPGDPQRCADVVNS
jgi:hypothetical protein